ncbi:MAG: hypothetical protein KGZ71_01590 [Desulfobulbaceae bacterium]|nr:hypothetical protein [Desulfobulbaceae bacterium]
MRTKAKYIKYLFLTIGLIIIGGCFSRPDDYTVNPLNILFIGNSLTHSNGGLDKILHKMFDSTDTPLKIRSMRIAPGGERLSGHYRKGDAVIQIKSIKWDYVVLQEYSTSPITDRENFYNYSKVFERIIRGTNAKTIFFMTWEYKEDPGMAAILANSYTAIADELGCQLVPVGLVWNKVRTERPDLELYSDFKHPNLVGSYLSACVFYSYLTGMNANESTYILGIDPEIAEYIQDIAFDTVKEWKKRYE